MAISFDEGFYKKDDKMETKRDEVTSGKKKHEKKNNYKQRKVIPSIMKTPMIKKQIKVVSSYNDYHNEGKKM